MRSKTKLRLSLAPAAISLAVSLSFSPLHGQEYNGGSVEHAGVSDFNNVADKETVHESGLTPGAHHNAVAAVAGGAAPGGSGPAKTGGATSIVGEIQGRVAMESKAPTGNDGTGSRKAGSTGTVLGMDEADSRTGPRIPINMGGFIPLGAAPAGNGGEGSGKTAKFVGNLAGGPGVGKTDKIMSNLAGETGSGNTGTKMGNSALGAVAGGAATVKPGAAAPIVGEFEKQGFNQNRR